MLSQCKLLTPYLLALHERGHQLTIIHAFDCDTMKQFHSIFVKDRHDTDSDFDAHQWDTVSEWVVLMSIRNFFVKIVLNVLESPEVQQLMHSNVSYDLVVLEPSNTDGLFGLAAHFNAILIGLGTCGSDWTMETFVGYRGSSTFEPVMWTGFNKGITLIERFYNWIRMSEEWMLYWLIFQPAQRAIHEHFFGHLEQSFEEIRQNFSLILLNQHFSFFEARASVPSMVDVGGMHVPKQLPTLPAELEQFIEEAQHGVIVMSLGPEIKSKDLPAEKLRIIVDTFEALPQRIIWKFEGNVRPNVSSSIYMSEWLPQQEIVAHPNCRLLISHGGILSIIEAAYYGKPVLGFPVFFDQFRNLERMQVEGMAQRLDISTLTRLEFETALREMLALPQYRRKALELSQRVRDQPMHPLDVAVFWTEYVWRHQGAPYMRVSTSKVKLFDYYYLDNILGVLSRFGLLIGLVVYVLCKLFKWR
ncbi:UDP-glycosyltransferase UGT5 isoform X1 [Drosophila grimshawi]|nr:UDP-glycosyltransferase UGT5 isoform X1 [Drosophila grimshawi]